MTSSTKRKVGWGLSILIALFLGFSASGKFTEWEGKAEMFAKMGVTNELIQKIGVLEIVITVLFIIPQTGFLGAILLTGYLGGAIMTHLRIGDPIVVPIIIGVLIWVALGLRHSQVFTLACGCGADRTTPPPAPVE